MSAPNRPTTTTAGTPADDQAEARYKYSVSVSQLAVAFVVLIVAAFLAIAMLTAGGAQTAPSLGEVRTDLSPNLAAAQESGNTASLQALAGFGLLALWFISGAVMIARARGSHRFHWGAIEESAQA